MPFDAEGYRRAAANSGIPKQLIEQTIAQNTGAKGWLTNGKSGVGGVVAGAGNILNTASYGIGGMLNRGQHATGSQYAQGNKAQGPGIIEGIKNKRAVMSELPETLGVDPNSGLGKGIGFAGELLTPTIPGAGQVGKLAKGVGMFGDAAKVANVAGDAVKPGILARGAQAMGEGLQKTSNDLTIGALRLPESSINAIEEAFGMPVQDVVRKYNLYGDKATVLPKLEEIATAQKAKRAEMLGNGAVSSQLVSNNFRQQALKYVENATPESRALAEDLWSRADMIDEMYKGGPMTLQQIDSLRKGGFDGVSQNALGKFTPAGKTQSARGALDVLDSSRPGYKALGTEQRGLIEFTDRLKSAPTGRGNQPFNAFKPSFGGGAAGFGVGTALGNPLLGMAIGGFGSKVANSPKFLSTASRGANATSRFLKSPKTTKALNATQNAATRLGTTGFRVSQQPNSYQGQQKLSQPASQQPLEKLTSTDYNIKDPSTLFNVRNRRK